MDVSEHAALSLKIISKLFTGDITSKVGVRLWDGSTWPDARPRPATLVLNHPCALRAMLMAGTELALAEAYIFGAVDIEGNMEDVFTLADRLLEATSGWRKKFGLARDLARIPRPDGYRQNRLGAIRLSGRRHTAERDKKAVTHHYDVSNEFYKLFLDSRMVYSCAYFQDEGDRLVPGGLRVTCRVCALRP